LKKSARNLSLSLLSKALVILNRKFLVDLTPDCRLEVVDFDLVFVSPLLPRVRHLLQYFEGHLAPSLSREALTATMAADQRQLEILSGSGFRSRRDVVRIASFPTLQT
jgi:hypothetical protein